MWHLVIWCLLIFRFFLLREFNKNKVKCEIICTHLFVFFPFFLVISNYSNYWIGKETKKLWHTAGKTKSTAKQNNDNNNISICSIVASNSSGSISMPKSMYMCVYHMYTYAAGTYTSVIAHHTAIECMCVFDWSFVHSYVRSLIHSVTHSRQHTLTHSLTAICVWHMCTQQRFDMCWKWAG